MGIPITFILTAILSDETFIYGDGVKFSGYVGTNSEKLCVEFRNCVQCLSL